ncbi:MAG: glycosyltransferase family 2 protein, partial [Acidobacteria bacterium]|nr:glycosyltransferase family 2 protein [Acidobacteriota bacterium]
SVIVITRDEARNVGGALDSVHWADEIVVVDSGSTDDTVAIARRHTDRVVTHTWNGYGAQKNFAAGLAAHDWVFSLDADERVTPALGQEIRALLAAGPTRQGYRIPRVTRYLGRWIRSTDWYPDRQLRLYDRRTGRWNDRRVHESVAVDGAVGRLQGELEHHAYRDISHHLRTIDRYSTLAADQMHAEGRRVRWMELVARPPLAFLRNYLARLGVRDGAPGLIVSILNSYYVFLKHAKRWEQQRASGTDPGAGLPKS